MKLLLTTSLLVFCLVGKGQTKDSTIHFGDYDGYGTIIHPDTSDYNMSDSIVYIGEWQTSGIIMSSASFRTVIHDSTGEVAYKDSVWHIIDPERTINALIEINKNYQKMYDDAQKTNEKYEAIIKEMMRRVMTYYEYKL